jgi:hypothetical protein
MGAQMKSPCRSLISLGARVLAASFLILGIQPARAGSANWLSNPPTGDWNNTANWTAAGPPNGSADTATFETSTQTAISCSVATEVGEIIFETGASPYMITASPMIVLTISGTGVTNSSLSLQNFVAAVNGANRGELRFSNNATAGSLNAFTTNGGAANGAFGGRVAFFNASTAGNSTFTNDGGTIDGASGGFIGFGDSSTAGNSTITNSGGSISAAFGGFTVFTNTSTAGNGAFTTNGGAVSGASGGFTEFFATSDAGAGTFITNGGAVSGASGGFIGFFNSSTAANGTFTNNGGTSSGTSGGETDFSNSASAGNATLIANGGLAGGSGGAIFFFGGSSGGTARVEVFGNGKLDINAHNAPGVTVGSIEGDGYVFLGSNQLALGNNSLATTFSGIIQGGGSLAKIGTGTISLANTNTYSGGTLVSAGTLQASADGALGSGNIGLTASGVILKLQGGATNNYIADTASLSVVSGSTVDLNFSGSAEIVDSLIVNGVAQAPGLYGGAASGAPNQLPEFAGTGKIRVPTSFAYWQQSYFTPSEIGDPNIGGENADPDQDGLSNLLEYAFNLDPKSPSTTNRPSSAIDSTYFSLIYTKVLGATDLTYSIEQSTDLMNWSVVSPTNEILDDNGVTELIKAKIAIGGATKLFLRLRVSN